MSGHTRALLDDKLADALAEAERLKDRRPGEALAVLRSAVASWLDACSSDDAVRGEAWSTVRPGHADVFGPWFSVKTVEGLAVMVRR